MKSNVCVLGVLNFFCSYLLVAGYVVILVEILMKNWEQRRAVEHVNEHVHVQIRIVSEFRIRKSQHM